MAPAPDGPPTSTVSGAKPRKIVDWISFPEEVELTPFQQFILDIDWKTSPLGPMKLWPPQLRQMVLLVVADPTPAVVYWGDEATIVYNEAYTLLIGQKHPALQGQDPKIEFAEIWAYFEQLLQTQRETYLAKIEGNQFLLLKRHGFLEETYFSWKFLPIVGNDGSVVGSYATVVEVTRQVISDRQLSTARTLSQEIGITDSVKSLWSQLIRGLEHADKDIPLALLYSVTDISTGINHSTAPHPISADQRMIMFNLEGSIGVPTGHPLAPAYFDYSSTESWPASLFRQAIKEHGPVVIDVAKSPIPNHMLDGIQWRGFGIPSTKMVIYPIQSAHSKTVLAFLIIALNPRRPYDTDYSNFLHMITTQVLTPQVSAVVLKEEIGRDRSTAREEAITRVRLSKELSARTLDFEESENKFARFAERTPVGLSIFDVTGLVLFGNKHWLDLTQLDLNSDLSSWDRAVVSEDLEMARVMFNRLVEEKVPVRFQFRLLKPWKVPISGDGEREEWTNTTVLCSAYPDLNEAGDVKTVMSCLTDISELKWIEAQLTAKMDQAIELKQKQERFVDMTSHELRNPLSAMLHCADEIISSLETFQASLQGNEENSSLLKDPKLTSLLSDASTATNTIIYCVMHQKRLVDEILLLSRLDSDLLDICPEPVQLQQLLQTALKMFESEVKQAKLTVLYNEHPSLRQLGIEWVLLDSSRVLQVFINLMTNAIKFTRNEPVKRITITVRASLIKPSLNNNDGIHYIPKSSSKRDQTLTGDWGNGEIIYLSLSVRDTGRGLSTQERTNLFHQFQQASPKTHVQYGGSGLGLFICRQMVEMQGGEIGVASEAGVGSIFTFFVKSRRTTAPAKTLASQNILQDKTIKDAIKAELEIPSNDSSIALGTQQQQVIGGNNISPAVENSTEHHHLHSTNSFNGLHILVVEDNILNQKVVVKQLRKQGCVVHVANQGEEALDFLQRSEYWGELGDAGSSLTLGTQLSVVLMDLEMPVMDGITCIRRIRQLQAEGKLNRHVPVIAVTANARQDQILECIAAGMDDVATKPYRIVDIVKQIEGVTAKQKASKGGR